MKEGNIQFNNQQNGEKVITFPVVSYEINKDKKIIVDSNSFSSLSKEQIRYKAFIYDASGDFLNASKFYQDFINQGFIDPKVFTNYGAILIRSGQRLEAKKMLHKAIDIQPNYFNAYYNLGVLSKDIGQYSDAVSYYSKAIDLKPDFAKAYINLSQVLFYLGQLNNAEKMLRNAIDLEPDNDMAYCDLGGILRDLGRFNEATESLLNSIQLNPELTKSYFLLSTLKNSNKNLLFKEKLFSDNIFSTISAKSKSELYFARSNILHQDKQYKKSAKYLTMANSLKYTFKSKSSINLIKKSNLLMLNSSKEKLSYTTNDNSAQRIFIVGMPRCGSTLIESILTINPLNKSFGELNIFEESYIQYKKLMVNNQDLQLSTIYSNKLSDFNDDTKISTSKCLSDYQYTGMILSHIPNAKIIHCFRHPLDNILSIYRSNFNRESEYSSSLVDATNVYLNHDKVMTYYKHRFPFMIYDLNYDLLVLNSKNQIENLISWLGWEWNDSYLKPHLNKRPVTTASSVQVRSPINSKSINGWKKYKEMLLPVIEILTKNKKYKHLTL